MASAVAVALLPLAVPTGPANVAPIDLFVGMAIAATLLWAGAAGHRWRFPFAISMALFIGGGALGGLAGSFPGTGAVALVQDLVLLAACWTFVNISYRPANLRVLMTTWAYSSVVWAVMPIVGVITGSHLLTGQTANQGSRVQITLADPSYAANYFFISIMLIWAIQRPRRRAVRIFAYAILLTSLALTGSNSGSVSLVVGCIVAVILGLHSRFGIVPAITAAAFIAFGGYFVAANVSLQSIQNAAAGSRYAFIRDGVGRGTSVEQRGILLHESIQLYERGSVLGEGPVSTKPRLRAEQAHFVKEAHDDYFAALNERGVIGFLGILLLVSSLAVRGTFVARARLPDAFAAVIARPNALVGAVAGTLVAGTVYELLHARHIWALFAFLAAVHLWARE